MSDLISRKVLIDTIEKNCYPIRYGRCSEENGMTVTGIMQAINEQPTAFDLESVIEQITAEEKRQLIEMEETLQNTDIDKQVVFLTYNAVMVTLGSVKELIKSAANSTNGKNGG